jgi:hypothetical protein
MERWGTYLLLEMLTALGLGRWSGCGMEVRRLVSLVQHVLLPLSLRLPIKDRYDTSIHIRILTKYMYIDAGSCGRIRSHSLIYSWKGGTLFFPLR